jgi:cytochrome c-type biogenesis protein CcmH
VTAASIAPARRFVGVVRGPIGWAALLVVIAATLTIGSIRPAGPSLAGRAAYLDSIIKCPTCDGLSIAQSDAGVAIALRREVRNLLSAGWSTPRIEARIEEQFGSDEILSPSSGVAWWLPTLVAATAAAGVGGVLLAARRRRRRAATSEDEALVRAELERLAGG